jgi:hypothetical protein
MGFVYGVDSMDKIKNLTEVYEKPTTSVSRLAPRKKLIGTGIRTR